MENGDCVLWPVGSVTFPVGPHKKTQVFLKFWAQETRGARYLLLNGRSCRPAKPVDWGLRFGSTVMALRMVVDEIVDLSEWRDVRWSLLGSDCPFDLSGFSPPLTDFSPVGGDGAVAKEGGSPSMQYFWHLQDFFCFMHGQVTCLGPTKRHLWEAPASPVPIEVLKAKGISENGAENRFSINSISKFPKAFKTPTDSG